jgi:hypothetical protein
MKRILVLALLAMMALGAVAFADEAKKEEAKPVTLTGEVIDLYCYMGHKGQGAEHAKCATACITKGMPVGYLTSDGTLYVIVGKDHAPANADVAAFAGKQSTITGKVMENNGVKAIELISIGDAAAAKTEEKKG